METQDQRQKTIVIMGGGASGALVAYHLSTAEGNANIILIDPRSELGLGLAYSTPSLRHLLNVPAGKISAIPSRPDHFLRWLKTNFDPGVDADTFAPRAIYGRYLQSLFARAHRVMRIQSSVVDVSRDGEIYTLSLQNGASLRADYLVLATGNFDPPRLPGVDIAATEGVYCHNAWIPSTYANLDPEEVVTLIGTGLTSVDVLLRLRELGHRGKIIAVSRHGVFPNRHAPYKKAASCAIPFGTSPTCVAYLRALRVAIEEGTEWRAAVDSLRASTNDLWLSLPLKEQRRFRRHLQRRWDVVRHRMAPPIANLIEAELASGSLVIRHGHLSSVKMVNGTAMVTIRDSQGEKSFVSNRVINCTGPDMNYHRVDSPLLRNLLSKGLVTPGPLGTGLRSDELGALVDSQDRVSDSFFNLGPGRLGVLLESIAMPEIREQAEQIASALIERLSGDRNTTLQKESSNAEAAA